MNGVDSLMRLFSNDLALVVGGESLWIVNGRGGEIERVPAYIAVQKEGRRVVAVGEEARKLKGRAPAGVIVLRAARFGGFEEYDIGEALVRSLFRKKSSWWRVAPRVLVACPQMSRMDIKGVVIVAGARDLITLPSVMAAAVGAGVAVEKPELWSVFILERDWCAFAVISRSSIIASFERRGGVEQLLEDIAVQNLATLAEVMDLEAMLDLFSVGGLVGLETRGQEAGVGRMAGQRGQTDVGSEVGRGALTFMHRLDLLHRQSLSTLSAAKMEEILGKPLHFCGPYSGLPGMAGLMERAFHQKVVVPRGPEEAMARGTQKVLRELGGLLSSFKENAKQVG